MLIDISFIFGCIGTCIINFAFLSQIIQIFKSKSSKDISYIQYSLMIVEFSLWISFYTLNGYTTINSYIPLVSNTFGLFYSVCIILLKLKYG